MSYSEKRKQLKQKHQSKQEDTLQSSSWEYLTTTCGKRFQTVFVGAVSKVEDSFGALWGNDEVDEENMTPEQLKWYTAFLELREQVFDQGNDQKNKFIKDLSRLKILQPWFKRRESENDQ